MNITAQELHDKLAAGEKILLIDVREPWEHDEFNLGGDLVPLGDLMNKMWELEDHKHDDIVLYCRSGNRSGMAQGLMMANGFTHVRNLTGGVLSWMNAYGMNKP